MLTVPKVIQVCETKIARCLCAGLNLYKKDLYLNQKKGRRTWSVHGEMNADTCVLSVYAQVT